MDKDEFLAAQRELEKEKKEQSEKESRGTCGLILVSIVILWLVMFFGMIALNAIVN